MDIVMDHGWIVTFASTASMTPQISVATEGGAGTEVPDISIEVDNLDDIWRKMVEVGIPIEYGPVEESWGVRRFFVRDPFGRLLNILMHL
jgi:catechol 2,3-dioxygenase-like lactoylglutathione lyase family enzyme